MAANPVQGGSAPQVDVAGTLDAAKGMLGQMQKMQGAVENAIFTSEQQRQQFSQQQGQLTVEAAQETARSAQLAAEAQASEQETHMRLLRAVGLDIEDPNSALRQEQSREATARYQRENADKEITQLEGINFFQNPIDFIMAQPRLQQLIPQYNEFARVENTSGQKVQEMQNLATTVMALTPAKNADLLRAKAQADANSVVKSAQAAAAQISAQNSAGYAKAMLDAWNIKHNMFASTLQVTDIEERIKDRRQREADSNFWKNIKLQEWNEARADKLEEKNKATAITAQINAYRKMLLGNSVPDMTVMDMKMMKPDEREMWYNVGLRGNFGNDYAQSIPFIGTFGNPAAAADAGNGAMMTTMRNVQARVEAKATEIIARERNTNPMNPAIKRTDAIQMALRELYAQDAGLGRKGSDKSLVAGANPYAIDFDAAAALGKQAVANKQDPGVVLQTLMDAQGRKPGVKLNDTYTPRMLFNDVEARVLAGSSDPKTAAEQLSRFMALQSTDAYKTNALKYFNLPQAVDWNVAVGSKGATMVDLMNPTQLENYLTAVTARNRRRANMVINDFTPAGSSNMFNTDIPAPKTKGVK